MSNEKRLWIIEARDGAWGANGICKGELVRCGECKHHEDEEMGMVYCPHIVGSWVAEDFYCADGERKDGEHDNQRM